MKSGPALPHNIRQARAQRVVKVGVYFLCAWMCGIGCFAAATMVYDGHVSGLGFWVNVSVLPVTAVLLWLTSKGYVRQVSWALVLFVLAATASIHFGGRPYTQASLLNIAVLTLFAGWALSMSGMAVVVVLCQLLLGVLVVQGALAWTVAVPLFFTSLFFGLTTLLVRRAYNRHVAQLEQAADTIREHEAYRLMLSSVVEQSPYSVAIVGLDGCIQYANAAFLQLSGYSEAEVLGHKARALGLPGMGNNDYRIMRRRIVAGRAWQGLVRNPNKHGDVRAEQVLVTPIVDGSGVLHSFVLAKLDISERVYAQERLHQLMNYDALTQLPNRSALERRLDDMLLQERERLGKEPSNHAPHIWHGLFLLDIDRFRSFNMVHGNDWGDALLVALATRLQELQNAHENMWVARFNDDKFALIVEHMGSFREQARDKALAFARALQGQIGEIQVEAGKQPVTISLGMGLTGFPFIEPGRVSDHSSHILRRAVLALAQAKKNGTDQVHSYSEVFAEQAQQYLQTQQELHHAIRGQQLRMYVQPQYDKNGHAVALEALVRWQHPQRGMVSPGQFIPVAEDSGQVLQIGQWMLEQACALLQTAPMRSRSCSVSVNISAQQFMQAEFVPHLQALLERTQAPPHRLVLEVTESTLLGDMQQVILIMKQLQAMGVELALDDFGTGYSSLSCLRNLPIQEVKIDQSFLVDLEPSGSSGVLVQAVLMIAKQMGLRVVAEGVEREGDAILLQAWEPTILCQGYFYSRPVPVEHWLQVLAATPPDAPVGKL